MQVEIKMGLLTLAYIGAKNEWPIHTTADPLLDLDVDPMQRRRKILATIAHYYPQSVDLRAKQKGIRPPYDQGEYGPMYISAAGQNNCAPFNVFIMGKATGKQAVSKKDGSSVPIWGFGMDVNPGFVKWTDGVAPSVGDTYYLDDGAGFKHHCGIIVGSSAIVGQVWMVADGGQRVRRDRASREGPGGLAVKSGADVEIGGVTSSSRRRSRPLSPRALADRGAARRASR